MKKTCILVILMFSVSALFAQSDSTMVEQYCTVIATPRMLSARVTINVDYGERRSIWKDNRLKDEEGRLKKFNTVVDALNYMGRNGWSLVNAFPVTTGANTFNYHYVFRKHFLASEVSDDD